MGQNTSPIPPKGLWAVKASDWIKGLWLAVSSGVLALGYFIISNHFRLPTMNEAEPYLQTIAAGFLAYIAKNFGTNNVGQFLKPDQPVVKVSEQKLEDLAEKAKVNDG